MKTIVTHSAADTFKAASDVLTLLDGGRFLALYGELGSGKTTFSQGIGRALGIMHRMLSPTFVIVRKYDVQLTSRDLAFNTLYHIDLYRIEKAEEVINLGIMDFIKDPASLVIVEWAEKMGKYLPTKRVDVRFMHLNEEKRKIVIESR